MKLAYPEFLWASSLIVIPIIIHLFNFRRYKTVYFSRVDFLQAVTLDSKSGLKLKHLLVLLSRIFAILFLVLAFAQPYIPSADQNNIQNCSLIYIDNSFSMQAIGKDGNLLNESKNQAIELVKSFEKTEKVVLMTADLTPSQFRFYAPDDVVESIKKIDFSPRSTSLTNVLNSQLDLVSGSAEKMNNRIFIFSDFQKTTSDLTEFKREEVPCYYYQAITEQPENIYIDSVWFESPVHRLNAPADVFFRIQNQSEMTQQDLTVSLKIDNSQPAPKRITVEANSFAIGSITFTDQVPGIKSGLIQVSTGQLNFDDEYYFTYEIKDQVEILVVKNSLSDPKNLEQLYGLDPYYAFSTTTLGSLTQEDFKNKELIIFQNANEIPGGVTDLIQQALKDGATVVLIPGSTADRNSWNTLLAEQNFPALGNFNASGELSYFNSEDPLYHGVFETVPKNYRLPKVIQSYAMSTGGTQNFVSLFGFNATRPYMIYGNRANGKLFLLGAPMDLKYTDFQNHALFATTFLRVAETASFQKPLSMTIGKMDNLAFNKPIHEKNSIHLINTEFKIDYIPLMINTGNSRMLSFAQMQDDIKNAGFYSLTDNADYKDVLALNYDRFESNTVCYDKEELAAVFANCGWMQVKPLSISSGGVLELDELKAQSYWKICVIICLIFVAVEIFLLKFWKT